MTDLERPPRLPRCHRPRPVGPVRPPAVHARGTGRGVTSADGAKERPLPARETRVINVAGETRGPRRRSRIGYHRLRWRRPKSPCPRHWSPWIPGLYWF